MSATFSSPGTGPAGNSAGKTTHASLEAALKTAQTLHKEVTETNKAIGEPKQQRLEYSMPPAPPPSYGGGSPSIPGPVRSAAADNGGRGDARSTWDQAKNIGSKIMAFMPSAAAGVERQQRTFYAGVSVGDYRLGELARKDAMIQMKGNLTSVNADVRMNQMMMNAGWNQKSQFRGVYDVSAFAARMSGVENEVSAAAHMATVGNIDFQNAGLLSGVRTKDKQGNSLTGTQLYESIYNRFVRGMRGGKDAFLRAMQPGHALATNEMISAMDPTDRKNFQDYVVNKLSGNATGQPGEADDPMKNPAVSAMGLTGAENQRVETSMDDSVKGYVYANQGLTKLSEGLDAAYKALGPFTMALQMLSGAMLAASQTMLGQSTMGAIDQGMDMLDGDGGDGGRRGRRGGRGTRGSPGGGTGSPGGSPGSRKAGRLTRSLAPGGKLGKVGKAGSALSRFGGKALGKVGGKMIPGVGLAVGGYYGYQAGKSGEGFWSGLGSATAGGAVAGGILGSLGFGAGAVPGALLGALGGAISHTIGYGLGQLNKTDEGKAAESMDAQEAAYANEGEAESGLVDTWSTEQPETRAKGAWKITKGEIARLHENEMVLPADVAESFRASVQNHLTMGEGDTNNKQRGYVKVDVTLNNASWNEAQKLIKIVQEAVDTTDELELLGSR